MSVLLFASLFTELSLVCQKRRKPKSAARFCKSAGNPKVQRAFVKSAGNPKVQRAFVKRAKMGWGVKSAILPKEPNFHIFTPWPLCRYFFTVVLLKSSINRDTLPRKAAGRCEAGPCPPILLFFFLLLLELRDLTMDICSYHVRGSPLALSPRNSHSGWLGPCSCRYLWPARLS